jgi:hypothetical protein
VTAGGAGPLTYQWYFNTTLIGPATATNYTIASATGGNQGNYSVVVRNNSGSVTSFVATLTLRVAPTISSPLHDQIVDPGSNVTFTVIAAGTAPLTYQWRFNGTSIAGATTNTLFRGNAQHTNGGIYSVTVGNAAGQVPSQAELFVRPTFSAMPPVSNGVLRLIVNGTPGKRYSIEGTGNYNGWAPVGSVTNTAVQSTFQDTATPGTNRIYRARLLIP